MKMNNIAVQNETRNYSGGATLISMISEDLEGRKKLISELCRQWMKLKPMINSYKAEQFETGLNEMMSKVNNTSQLLAQIQPVSSSFNSWLEMNGSLLSGDEKRMCRMIKMGMRNKEIAEMLHILPGSVKKSQSRIKRKLQLEANITLRKYISQIG